MIGRTLARTYQVERLLGGGGMGAVYSARHVRTGGIFAVKVLHRETASDADIYKRFQDEARTVSALRHPHIVQVTDFDRDDDGTPFIVMELLEGEDLYQRLCRVGKLPLDQVLDIGRQVGSALHAAHDKGIIHRDIKPQNIFLVRHELADMVSEIAKVVDFGISKIRRSGAQMTRDMTILGTPQFMSPEAALGQNSQMDGRADQWSLAVIMYLSLSGQLPFDGENLVGVLYMVVHEQPVPLKQLAPDTPDYVIAAINRAMAKKKEDRFPKMADFVRAIIGQAQGGGAGIRLTAGLKMDSAMFKLPLPADPAAQSQPDAITAVPHLQNPSPPPRNLPPNRPPAPPGLSPAPNPNEVPTRLNLSGDQLPLTVPVLPQPPELVATPSSPTAMAPFPRGRLPSLAKQQSGDTPTSITLNPEEMRATLAAAQQADPSARAASGLRPLSGPNEPTSQIDSGADSSVTPQDLIPIEPEQFDGPTTKSKAAGESGDLLGVPTRVGQLQQTTQPSYQPSLPSKATIPLMALKRPTPGSTIDTAYPSTLSRATGQQDGSLKQKLLAKVDWVKLREQALAISGLAPREPRRLAIAGGSLGALLFLLLLLLVVRSIGGKPQGAGDQLATPQPQQVDPTDRDATKPKAGDPAKDSDPPAGTKPGSGGSDPPPGKDVPPSGSPGENPSANPPPSGTANEPGKKPKGATSPATKKPGGKGGRKPKVF